MLVGPAVYSLSKAYYKHFNGKKLLGQNKRAWILSPSENELGRVAPVEKINELANKFIKQFVAQVGQVKQRSWLVAVNGDDNLVFVSYGGKMNIYTSDGKRWDATMMADAISAEHHIYSWSISGHAPIHVTGEPMNVGRETVTLQKGCYGGGSSTLDFLAREAGLDKDGIKRYKFDGDGDDEVSITARGPTCRDSGSQRTSIGNGVLNISACIDFCETWTPAHTLQDWENHWINLGVDPEAAEHKTLGTADFCSHRFMPVDGTYYLVPKFGKYILRMGWSRLRPKSVTELRGLLNQFKEYENVPFLGPYLAKCRLLLMCDMAKGKDPSDMKYHLSYGLKDTVPPPGNDTWEWLHEIYGVGREESLAWQNQLDTISALPFKIDYSSIAQILKEDC